MMKACADRADEQTRMTPVAFNLDLGTPHKTPNIPIKWQKTGPPVNPFELVNDLAQAYEASLCLHNVLRPLMPKTTWYQATNVAWQREENWPVEELTASIMFTDITGFTALIETHPVTEVLTSLNEYFALLSRIVQRRRGDVLKFLGDGLMALFICPTDAVRAGCEIQRTVIKFNARQAAQGLWRFETRLAIDTGEVVLTSVGSPERRDHTLIGRPVNRAAHLMEEATPGTVWISESAYDGLTSKDDFAVRTESWDKDDEGSTAVYEIACL